MRAACPGAPTSARQILMSLVSLTKARRPAARRRTRRKTTPAARVDADDTEFDFGGGADDADAAQDDPSGEHAENTPDEDAGEDGEQMDPEMIEKLRSLGYLD